VKIDWKPVLTDWLVQWLEFLPLDQEVTGSIPGSGLAFFSSKITIHYLLCIAFSAFFIPTIKREVSVVTTRI
jgi:hypothetical protein